ncbi:unnamed protein product [Victoria cruziana]
MIPAGVWVSSAGRIQVAPFFFFFLHFLFNPVYSATNPNFTACAPQTCGTYIVKYPFSLSSQSGSGCGYPGLTLLCNDNSQTLLLPTSTVNFTVTSIDYPDHTIDVAIDPNNIVGAGNCLYPQKNITTQEISRLPLAFSGDTAQATFFYNCSTPPTGGGGNSFAGSGSTYDITSKVVSACSAGAQRSYIFLNGDQPGVTMNCNSIFTFPASSTSNNLTTALSSGFSMNWTMDGATTCDSCVQSGGRCGSNSDGSFACFCQGDTHQTNCNNSSGNKTKQTLKGMLRALIYGSLYEKCMYYLGLKNLSNKIVNNLSCIVGAVVLLIMISILCCYKRCNFPWRYRSLTTAKLENFINEYRSLTVSRYTYKEIKRMTKKFEHKLGEGAYGRVFKGKLPGGRLVAVKLLQKTYNNGEEFINEVATIGRIHHVNVVRLLGFVVEGSKRALIYEFMANGSLDKHIQMNEATGNRHLVEEKLQSIALAIAKGIEYLHQGCDQGIIHLDIKPHNILLDEDFTPKVSDFGLAKLHRKEQSHVTITQGKGTIGYVAPEVFYGNLNHVSHKSDVYSFGMLLMAMVGLKDKTYLSGSNTSDSYFPHCIYDRLCHDTREVVQIDGEETMKKMTIIALWCILWNPADRPSMKDVIGMFEGDAADLEMPPKTFFPAAQSDRLDFESSTFSN